MSYTKTTRTFADQADSVPTAANCPGCGASAGIDFFEIQGAPVHCGRLADTREAALQEPVGDIRLVYCPRCTLVYNRSFELENVDFSPGYEATLVHSRVFRDFLVGVAERLIERYNLRDKDILEIGCGSGYFLRLLCGLGANRGVGIDPTVVKEGTEPVDGGSVRLIRDYFSERYADLVADFVCCLSVFEDIPRPFQFLRDLRRMIGSRQTGLYFEVFNAARAFADEETWSIHYEQCNYFGLESLTRLFVGSGFRVLEADTCYQGQQYVYVEAEPADEFRPAASGQAGIVNELPAEIARFADRHRTKLRSWRERLQAWQREGKRAVVWGSGGKGISFLNALDTSQLISRVVDINPDRQGKFIPCSAQEIVSPQQLCQDHPDVVIVTNVLYRSEIEKQVQELGIKCDFYVA